MSLIVSAKPTANFEPIPAGMHAAYCYGMIDNGEQWSEKYKNWSGQVTIMWEIPGETIEINGEQVSRTISNTYGNSLGEKSKLRAMLVSWRGKPFKPEELEAFDLRRIVGAPCMLNVIHTEKNGSTYANISSVTPLPKGMPIAPKTLAPLFFDADEDPLEAIDDLPEWLQKRIKESQTYKIRAGLMEAPKKDVNLEDMKLPGDPDYYTDNAEPDPDDPF